MIRLGLPKGLDRKAEAAVAALGSDEEDPVVGFDFSRRACEVFSKLLVFPISYHCPVSTSRSKNIPWEL
jgi:hypothetical protein